MIDPLLIGLLGVHPNKLHSISIATYGLIHYETTTDLSVDDFIKHELKLSLERALLRRRQKRSSSTTSSSSSSTSAAYNVNVFVECDLTKNEIEILEVKLLNEQFCDSVNVIVESFRVKNDKSVDVFVTLKNST